MFPKIVVKVIHVTQKVPGSLGMSCTVHGQKKRPKVFWHNFMNIHRIWIIFCSEETPRLYVLCETIFLPFSLIFTPGARLNPQMKVLKTPQKLYLRSKIAISPK